MAHVLLSEMKALQQHKKNVSLDFKDIRSTHNEAFHTDVNIINAWLLATKHTKSSKAEFLKLLRHTLLYIFTPNWKESRQKDIITYFALYCQKFPTVIANCREIYTAVRRVASDPWKNCFFPWFDLFQENVTFADKDAQDYLSSEPEEIVLARVHSLFIRKNETGALKLSKCSFLYHSRITKHVAQLTSKLCGIKKTTNSVDVKSRTGFASMDWLLFLLQRIKSLPVIVKEVRQMTCHEGVQLICRLRRNKKNKSFSYVLLQIFLMQDLLHSSTYCCTKKLFTLWCMMLKEMNLDVTEIKDRVNKIIAMYAPTSAHFYLFVDALWEQFGTTSNKFIHLYVELYVRGLTVDINYLEASRYAESSADVGSLETHIAAVFSKLCTLFSDSHETAARECMFSAFSLRPTKERLFILQSLTQRILSETVDQQEQSSSDCYELLPFNECTCGMRCRGPCKGSSQVLEFVHPLLDKGIKNIPYILVKDLVCILEYVRCSSFQYNIFQWRKHGTDLGDYITVFNQERYLRDWGSDTELASDASNGSRPEGAKQASELNNLYVSLSENVPSVDSHLKRKRDILDVLANKNFSSAESHVKMKSDSKDTGEMYSLDIGANIEVKSDDNVSKRSKIQKSDSSELFHQLSRPAFNNGSHMQTAIENVIRMTLSDKISQFGSLQKHPAKSLSQSNDGTNSLTLPSNQLLPGKHSVYPYSLTSCGKQQNLTSNPKLPLEKNLNSIKASVECKNNYMIQFGNKDNAVNTQFPLNEAVRQNVTTPSTSSCQERFNPYRSSDIRSPSGSFQKAVMKSTVSLPTYSSGKGIVSETNVNHAHVKDITPEPEALNLCSNSGYERSRIQNIISRATNSLSTAQYITKMHHQESSSEVISKSSNSTYFDQSQYSYNKTSPYFKSVNNVPIPAHQQSVQYPRSSHRDLMPSSKSDSRLQASVSNSMYQLEATGGHKSCSAEAKKSLSASENSLVPSDRHSVIQHTMQHVNEKSVHIPSQVSVSVNSSAVQQIRNNSNKEGTNMPPSIRVNMAGKTISKANIAAVRASLVIAREPNNNALPICSQLVTSAPTPSNDSNNTITIPGILQVSPVIASPVIMTPPGETDQKNNPEVYYQKNVCLSGTSVKRIYRKPYARQPKPVVKPETEKSSKNIEMYVKKEPIIRMVHRLNQSSFIASNQDWSSESDKTNTTASLNSSAQTSNSPWYCVPYPKSTSHVSEKNVVNMLNSELHVTAVSNDELKNSSINTYLYSVNNSLQGKSSTNNYIGEEERSLNLFNSECSELQITAVSDNKRKSPAAINTCIYSSNNHSPDRNSPSVSFANNNSNTVKIPLNKEKVPLNLFNPEQQTGTISNMKVKSFPPLTCHLYSKNDLHGRNSPSLNSKILSMTGSHSGTMKSVSQFPIGHANTQMRNAHAAPKKQFLSKLSSNSVSALSSPVSTPSSTFSSIDKTMNTPNATENMYKGNSHCSTVLVKDESGPVIFQASNSILMSSQYSSTQNSINDCSAKVCCSPLEINPCQNCSLSTEANPLLSGKGYETSEQRRSSNMANILFISSANRWIHR